MIPERIRELLVDLAPAPACDDCIQKDLGLRRRQQVQPVTSTLGLTSEFIREQNICSICKSSKLVTRVASPPTVRLPTR